MFNGPIQRTVCRVGGARSAPTLTCAGRSFGQVSGARRATRDADGQTRAANKRVNNWLRRASPADVETVNLRSVAFVQVSRRRRRRRLVWAASGSSWDRDEDADEDEFCGCGGCGRSCFLGRAKNEAHEFSWPRVRPIARLPAPTGKRAAPFYSSLSLLLLLLSLSLSLSCVRAPAISYARPVLAKPFTSPTTPTRLASFRGHRRPTSGGGGGRCADSLAEWFKLTALLV